MKFSILIACVLSITLLAQYANAQFLVQSLVPGSLSQPSFVRFPLFPPVPPIRVSPLSLFTGGFHPDSANVVPAQQAFPAQQALPAQQTLPAQQALPAQQGDQSAVQQTQQTFVNPQGGAIIGSQVFPGANAPPVESGANLKLFGKRSAAEDETELNSTSRINRIDETKCVLSIKNHTLKCHGQSLNQVCKFKESRFHLRQLSITVPKLQIVPDSKDGMVKIVPAGKSSSDETEKPFVNRKTKESFKLLTIASISHKKESHTSEPGNEKLTLTGRTEKCWSQLIQSLAQVNHEIPLKWTTN